MKVYAYFVFVVSLIACSWKPVTVHGKRMEMEDENPDRILNCETSDGAQAQRPERAMIFEDEQLCCGTENFKRGTGSSMLMYFGDCNVQPKNETMSLEDSIWTFYECVIKKALGSKEFTQQSYVELLAQNLSDGKRSEILSLANELGAAAGSKPIESNVKDPLLSIKNYWNNYFEAEYKVCTGSSKNIMKNLWDPSISCMNGKTPKIWFVPATFSEVSKCAKMFHEEFPAITNSTFPLPVPLNHAIKAICALKQKGIIANGEMIKSNFNFEAVFTKAIPQYYSKMVKDQFLSGFLENTRIKHASNLPSGTSAGVQEIAKEIMKSVDETFGSVVPTGLKTMYLNVATLLEVVHEGMNAMFKICYGQRDPVM